MPLTLVVFAGFYPTPRHTVHYASTLAQALHGPLVLLHVNRASQFDPYALMAGNFHQQELNRQTETAAALGRLARELPTQPTVEVATDLLPAVARDLARRHAPALFVLSQPAAQPADDGLAEACAELLRAGRFPLLVVPATAPAGQPPRRLLIAADAEPFELGNLAASLRPLLGLPGATLIVAHVSGRVQDDAGCSAALHAVQLSGLVQGLPTPELRGYENDDFAAGLLAAVHDTRADMVVLLARERSYLGELFHRSVTARLLAHSPVPVLVLPVLAPAGRPDAGQVATAAQLAGTVLAGLAPAS